MNAKMIVALKGIRDNLTLFIDEVEKTSVAPVTAEPKAETPVAKNETPASETPATQTPTKSRKEREASEELPDATNGITVEQLDGLSYNNLKRLAKEMGIPATGARDELTQKILNYTGEVPSPDAEVDDEPEEEVAPAKSPRDGSVSKEDEVADDASEDGDDDEEVDPIVQKVNEAVEDMTNEEIMDVLADVGVKAKGKRQSLISAVIKAVREGKIDLDDEDEDEEETEVESQSEPESEWDVNDPENPDMTKERKTAITAYESEIREDFENGALTRSELVDWLNEFHGTKDPMKKKSDDDILDEYIYYSCLLIDDEGEMPEEEGAYTVNGVPYCCGHELSYNEDNETYVCEVCGGEYEAGEE